MPKWKSPISADQKLYLHYRFASRVLGSDLNAAFLCGARSHKVCMFSPCSRGYVFSTTIYSRQAGELNWKQNFKYSRCEWECECVCAVLRKWASIIGRKWADLIKWIICQAKTPNVCWFQLLKCEKFQFYITVNGKSFETVGWTKHAICRRLLGCGKILHYRLTF